MKVKKLVEFLKIFDENTEIVIQNRNYYKDVEVHATVVRQEHDNLFLHSMARDCKNDQVAIVIGERT